MGLCTSKSSTSTKPILYTPGGEFKEDFISTAKSPFNRTNGVQQNRNQQNEGSEEVGAHSLFSKKSPAPSTKSTPKRLFKWAFPPPSLAKHIRAVLARRHGTVNPNEGLLPEAGTELDKSFGFSKNFANKYELGDGIGRGHFGYACVAKCKKGELKGQQVAVKVMPKATINTAIAIEDV